MKRLLVSLLLLLLPVRVDAQIYRIDGSLIPGTNNIHVGFGVDLSNLDLSNANLADEMLIFANLNHTILTGANLTNAEILVDSVDTVFQNANLTGADLSKSTFDGADFSNANFSRAYLGGVQFDNSTFKGANFRTADASISFFSGSDFGNADLRTNLTDTIFWGDSNTYNQWTQFPQTFQPASKLEYHASRLGDFDVSGALNEADLDLLATLLQGGDPVGYAPLKMFDVNGDSLKNADDLNTWVHDLQHTWFGDANLDGRFGTDDLVDVFQAGEYEDQIEKNSHWSTGDWDLDRDFTSNDLVQAFQDGGFEAGERTNARPVPEPATWWHAIALAAWACGVRLRSRRCADAVRVV